MLNKLLLILLLIVLSGCVSTEITSFRDPEFKEVNYRKILVCAKSHDPLINKQFEDEMKYELDYQKIEGALCTALFMPSREYSNDEYQAVINRENIDAILSVEAKNANAGINLFASVSTGVPVSSSFISLESKLLDAKTSKCSWQSNSQTKYNAVAGLEGNTSAMRSMSRAIVGKLLEDKIITPAK